MADEKTTSESPPDLTGAWQNQGSLVPASVVLVTGARTALKTIRQESDLDIDAQDYPNPYRMSGLRELDGLHKDVLQWFLEQKSPKHKQVVVKDIIKMIWLSKVLPGIGDLVEQFGTDPIDPPYLMTVGCFGGHHRSAAIGWALAQYIQADFRGLVLEWRRVPYDGAHNGQYPAITMVDQIPIILRSVPTKDHGSLATGGVACP